jgi:hypothetical protein
VVPTAGLNVALGPSTVSMMPFSSASAILMVLVVRPVAPGDGH